MSDLPTKHEGDGSKRDIDDVIGHIIGGTHREALERQR